MPPDTIHDRTNPSLCARNVIKSHTRSHTSFHEGRGVACGRPRGQTDIAPQLGLTVLPAHAVWPKGKKDKAASERFPPG